MENNLISELRFKGKWRSYQQRVLDELEIHLDDNKLNIVAAPGAGKTTLGIEVLLRLKNNAFILAPTLTIRNQWKERILSNFLPEEFDKDLISTDIKNIREITISTYQALHSLCKNSDDREKFISELKEKNINTIVFDEAHHLRTEWWATLDDLYDSLYNKNLKIISLTGTPPYDVTPAEWKNYSSLCGPTDAEISIPELVQAGDLCPHQDLIYFSDLTQEEQKLVYDFEEKRNEFFRYIKENSDLLYGIEGSVFINDLEKNVEIIYKDTNFTVSVISYLLSEDELSMNARILTEFLGLKINQIPKFDYSQAETLFNGLIGEFQPYFKNTDKIKSKLRELKLINGKKVDFQGRVDFKKIFARSNNKLEAIYNITDFEYKNLKENLREVVLLDYIGKGDSEGLNILSVFDKISPLNIPCGILTGTLISIPKSVKDNLYQILDKRKIDRKKVLTSDYNNDYIRVETYGNIDIVSVITELFEHGFLNILIGTAALLGEGWDSPCTNTLIIASVVGSFMLSNQMRGRALRIDKNKKNKTSNIWHLVSLTKDYELSPDFLVAQKRFDTFEGISYNETKIQNGISRLGLDKITLDRLNCKRLNEIMFEFGAKRECLAENWKQVFTETSIKESKMAPRVYDIITSDNIQNSIICRKIPTWCFGVNGLIRHISTSRRRENINVFEKTILKIFHHYKYISDDYLKVINKNYYAFKNEASLKGLSYALLRTLCDLSVIHTKVSDIQIKCDEKLDSNFFMTLTNCTNYERNVYIKSFNEIFEINDKTRYVLKQNGKYLGVPECIAKHSRNVKKFVQYLEKKFGYFDIIYTRNPNGYKELLIAKYNKMNFGQLSQTRLWM